MLCLSIWYFIQLIFVGNLQTGGCMVSLYIISPKMTLITMTAVPLVILVGTAFGALLRGLSRSSQSQSAIAAAVADEAFANIRTVRAFAMERQEIAWVLFSSSNLLCLMDSKMPCYSNKKVERYYISFLHHLKTLWMLSLKVTSNVHFFRSTSGKRHSDCWYLRRNMHQKFDPVFCQITLALESLFESFYAYIRTQSEVFLSGM